METYEYIIKKFNINVGRQYTVDIPEMVGSVSLVKLFAELGFTKGAEIGVDRGLFSEYMCQNIPNLHLTGVDPWTRDVFEDGNPYKLDQSYFDGCYEEAKRRLAPYNYTLIKKKSMDALADVPDNSLDFVYIDANHDFVNFSRDLDGWKHKVRPGGIVSGHDYAYYSFRKVNHVKRALDAYAICYRMHPIFAVMYDPSGLKRDRYRSWFWVKQ